MHALDKLFDQFNSHDPFEIADYLGIDIIYTDNLPKNYKGLSLNEIGCIFLDSKIKGTSFSIFICSHELVHAVCHDGYTEFLCSFTRKKRADGERGRLWCLLHS